MSFSISGSGSGVSGSGSMVASGATSSVSTGSGGHGSKPSFLDELHYVDTIEKCRKSLDLLRAASVLAVDVEGVNLGRRGKICILQIVDQAHPKSVHVFDMHILGRDGYQIPDESGRVTLKSLLESDAVTKVFWDVRADNDALYPLGVTLKNVIDLQVAHAMELKRSSGFAPSKLAGLQKYLLEHSVAPYAEAMEVDRIKREAKRIFAPEFGGSYEVWARDRPLPEILIHYCTDAIYFFPLMDRLRAREHAADPIFQEAIAQRLALAQSPVYDARSRDNVNTDRALRGGGSGGGFGTGGGGFGSSGGYGGGGYGRRW